MEFDRIVVSADTLGGKPRIKDTRIGVNLIVRYINRVQLSNGLLKAILT
jgi:uncharacterized protein (DUF433 family)